MAELDDLKAENDRLAQANDDLKKTNHQLRKGVAPADPALAQENAVLRAKLGDVEAARGPRAGTVIRYMRPGETLSRPGEVLSDGYTERLKVAGGEKLHAHIRYAERPDSPARDKDGNVLPHAFECDAPYDKLQKPGTWCLPEDEQAHLAFRAPQAP